MKPLLFLAFHSDWSCRLCPDKSNFLCRFACISWISSFLVLCNTDTVAVFITFHFLDFFWCRECSFDNCSFGIDCSDSWGWGSLIHMSHMGEALSRKVTFERGKVIIHFLLRRKASWREHIQRKCTDSHSKTYHIALWTLYTSDAEPLIDSPFSQFS